MAPLIGSFVILSLIVPLILPTDSGFLQVMIVEKMKNDIVLRIGQAYLQILFNKEQVEISQNQVDISNMQIERTKKLFEAGTIRCTAEPQ